MIYDSHLIDDNKVSPFGEVSWNEHEGHKVIENVLYGSIGCQENSLEEWWTPEDL